MLKRIFLALALAASLAVPALASSVRDLELDQIINDAGVAFEGTVIETHSAVDPVSHRIVTYTTFQVRDKLKGKLGDTHTIKQLGGEVEGEFYRTGLRTRYTVGDNVVVFLYRESSIGFSSPVGTSQGNFRIVDDGTGTGRAVTNGREFGEMTRNMTRDANVSSAVAKSRADGKQLGLEDFKKIVRARVGGGQ